MPEPPKKTWGHGLLRSVGGVYLTASVQRACLFAERAVSVHGGLKTIVVTDVEPRSAFADEDDVSRLLKWAVEISGGSNITDVFFGLLEGFDGISPHRKLRACVSSLLEEGVRIEMSRRDGSVQECEALAYYDRLSRSLRKIAWASKRNPDDRALRLPLPVRPNRGRNRVLSVLFVENDNSLRPVFGSDKLPSTFFFQWRKAFGDLRFIEESS